MIVFDCAVCRTRLSAQEAQVGSWVLCPNCRTKLQVPKRVTAAPVKETVGGVGGFEGVGAVGGRPAVSPPVPSSPRAAPSPPVPRPTRTFGKLYGFNCSYCSSRLEATESMAAQEGQCPTCGNSITIPIKDRFGRLIDPKTRQIIKQDPHPVHAYAAAGDRAPVIVRSGDGKQTIRCGRCSAVSPITANNCKACGMPFTMEGTTIESPASTNGFAITGLLLGIVGLIASCMTVFPSILAVILGGIAMHQISRRENAGSKAMPAMAIVFGLIGLTSWAYYAFR